MLILQNDWIVTYMRTYIAFLVVNGVRGSSSSSVDNKDCAGFILFLFKLTLIKLGSLKLAFSGVD